MAIATQLSLDEYLATAYHPDCDYVDGQLEERNLGKFDHSNLQRALIGTLFNREREWRIRVLPEQRVRVSATRVRIPDVCILSRDQPIEPVFTRPPLVCIEILSECDTLRTTRPRLTDYYHFGVPNLWVFDPESREAWICRAAGIELASEILEVPGTPVQIHLPSLFAHLD